MDQVLAIYDIKEKISAALQGNDYQNAEKVKCLLEDINHDLSAFLTLGIDFKHVVEALDDSIFISDKNGICIYVNPAHQRNTEISPEEVLGKDIHDIVADGSLFTGGATIDVLKTQKKAFRLATVNKTTPPSIGYTVGVPLFAADGSLHQVVVSSRPVLSLQALQEDYEKFLKEINLPLCVSGRLYADNFVVCYEAGKGDSRRMINTLQMVADSFAINNRTILSFGLYRIDDKTLPVSVMCDRANMALWKAKGNFKNPYCEYDEKMRQQVLKEQKIINAMEMAIQNKEFTLYLQPKYDIEKGTIIGAEALVRWISQENGFISPGDFIPVFENNGFVYEVDKFIWEESCRYLRKWLDEGREVHPISVNVSRIDLYDPKLVKHLVDLREKYQLPSQYLELEITESAYTEAPEQIITITRQLREAGFVILMDDFGTGYSSLNMLKDIQIDVLKLDMGFLKSSDYSAKGGNILTAILKMAESLKMQTIAEGVETKEQVEFLKSIGCKYVQGFYYSKPLPVDEFEKLI